jgi:hypothetical protein
VDSDEDSDAYVKPVKKTKSTAMAQSMTDFFEKKLAGSKGAAKPGCGTTAGKPPGSTKPRPKKATVKKAAQGSDNEISMDELQLESAPPVAPRATAPRRAAAAAKPADIELSDSNDND